MKISKHIKIALIINGAILASLIVFILAHNARTLLTGQEDKLFFFLFIIAFFLFPVSVVYTFIAISVSLAVNSYRKKKKIEEEREEREMNNM